MTSLVSTVAACMGGAAAVDGVTSRPEVEAWRDESASKSSEGGGSNTSDMVSDIVGSVTSSRKR